MAEKQFTGMLKMRQLPKAEYRLMKAMISHLDLRDEAELFTVLLVLGYEALRLQLPNGGSGQEWIRNIIDHTRSTVQEARVYELST